MKTVLVTGAAGFIGSYVCQSFLDQGWKVVGLDAMTDYYDVALKKARLHRLTGARFNFVERWVEEPGGLQTLFADYRFDVVVHLAAQAGVRYSIEAPRSYLDSNIVGTFELLEAARAYPPSHMLLASTSSAYGANREMPYSEMMKADHQISFYAATKKATEVMAHSYAHLYDLPITMFRFFTVYGPWGRPDMALFKFTKAILAGEPIDVYNYGNMRRDFTYIDDLVAGLMALVETTPEVEPSKHVKNDSVSPVAPWRVVNLGNGQPVELHAFISAIEDATGLAAIKNLLPMQPGDVPATWANTSLLEQLTHRLPQTQIQEGVRCFVNWYRSYYEA